MIHRAKPARLLGAHVLRRPEHGARSRARRPGRAGVSELRDTEVDDLRDIHVIFLVTDQKHVLRLEVAVDDAALVCPGEGTTDVQRDTRRLFRRETALAIEPVIQGLACEKLHDDVRTPVVPHALVVDLHDMLAAEPRRGACLVDEALPHVVARRVLGVDELHRHTRPEVLVDAFPDRPHPAAPEEARQAILASDQARRRFRFLGGGHRTTALLTDDAGSGRRAYPSYGGFSGLSLHSRRTKTKRTHVDRGASFTNVRCRVRCNEPGPR